MEFDTGSAWVASRRLASSEIEGEAVVLNLQDGHYYGLNPLAAQVWSWLQQPRTMDQLAELLHAEYEVDLETARRDVTGLLGDLRQRGLIEAAL